MDALQARAAVAQLRKEAEAGAGGKLRVEFDDFLKTRQIAGNAISKEQRDVLFQQFMTWYSNKK